MSIKDIQNACLHHKGAYVHYSQGEEPTATLISMLPYTKDGICQALSAKWIAEHANDRSLWTWLLKPGTRIPDAGKIVNLMINFTESTVRTSSDVQTIGTKRTKERIAKRLSNPTTRNRNTGGQFYQDFVTDKYLAMFGVKRRALPKAAVMGSMGNRMKYGFGPTTGLKLAATLQRKSLVTLGGAYALISIMGNGGHAMAAFVGEDVAFFDPNFGEFWFPSDRDFRGFFGSFWSLSGYDSEFDSYYLMSYAR